MVVRIVHVEVLAPTVGALDAQCVRQAHSHPPGPSQAPARNTHGDHVVGVVDPVRHPAASRALTAIETVCAASRTGRRPHLGEVGVPRGTDLHLVGLHPDSAKIREPHSNSHGEGRVPDEGSSDIGFRNAGPGRGRLPFRSEVNLPDVTGTVMKDNSRRTLDGVSSGRHSRQDSDGEDSTDEPGRQLLEHVTRPLGANARPVISRSLVHHGKPVGQLPCSAPPCPGAIVSPGHFAQTPPLRAVRAALANQRPALIGLVMNRSLVACDRQPNSGEPRRPLRRCPVAGAVHTGYTLRSKTAADAAQPQKVKVQVSRRSATPQRPDGPAD
jgi:hypothetical protein